MKRPSVETILCGLPAALVLAGSAVVLFPLHRAGLLLHNDDALVVASASTGGFPFADGWRDADRVDRILPPLHTLVARLFGGTLADARLASWSEGAVAAAFTYAWGWLRGGPRVGGLAACLLLLWHLPLGGRHWLLPWWDFASLARQDMAGMLGVALVGLLVERARSARAWTVAAFVATGMVLGHLYGVFVLVAATAWAMREREARRAWLVGVAAGAVASAGWYLSAGLDAAMQGLVHVERLSASMGELSRWAPLWTWPRFGGVLFVVLPAVALMRDRSWPAVCLWGSWAAMALLDHSSRSHYPLLALPALVVAVASWTLAAPSRFERVTGLLLAGGLLLDGAHRVTRARPPDPSTEAELKAALDAALEPDDRVLLDLRFWEAARTHPTLSHLFVYQWRRDPDDGRGMIERLEHWCPSVVVRNRPDWDHARNFPDTGGPEFEAWISAHVAEWRPVAGGASYPGLEVGHIATIPACETTGRTR